MSAPSVPSPRRSYSDAMWNIYITEAIQSGNHLQCCTQHNIPYTTFRNKFSEYKQSTDKENWSPISKRRYNNHVFTDSIKPQYNMSTKRATKRKSTMDECG